MGKDLKINKNKLPHLSYFYHLKSGRSCQKHLPFQRASVSRETLSGRFPAISALVQPRARGYRHAMGKDRIELIARGVMVASGHLLLCRNCLRGHTFLPGGHVDFAEKAREALIRELDEEAGLLVDAGPFLGVCESTFTQAGKHGRRVHHEVNLVYLLTVKAGRLGRKAGDGRSRSTTRSHRAVGPPPVVSREDPIEFFWAPIRDLIPRGKRKPEPRVFPEGIVEFALKNIRGKRDTHALTVWKDKA
jgi:ADP-ribose pyrophosphatase YjhB (NUDIX family)